MAGFAFRNGFPSVCGGSFEIILCDQFERQTDQCAALPRYLYGIRFICLWKIIFPIFEPIKKYLSVLCGTFNIFRRYIRFEIFYRFIERAHQVVIIVLKIELRRLNPDHAPREAFSPLFHAGARHRCDHLVGASPLTMQRVWG